MLPLCYTSSLFMSFFLPTLAIFCILVLVGLKKYRHQLPFVSHLPSAPVYQSIRSFSAGGKVISQHTISPYPFFVPVFYSQGIRIFGVVITYNRLAAIILTILLGMFVLRTYYCVQKQEELIAMLEDTIDKLSSPNIPTYPVELYDGKGIVFCGGGRRQLSMIYANIYLLREVLRCTLPIEVFHIGLGEMTQRQRALLEGNFENVKVRDVFSFDVEERWHDFFMGDSKSGHLNAFNLDDGRVGLKKILSHSKFAVKPFVLLFSSFREVVLLDHDTIPVKDPEILFREDPGYREKGNIFWKDVDLNRPAREFFAGIQTAFIAKLGPKVVISKREDFGFEETETGQWIVDKQRCWEGIYAAWLLASRAEVTMQYMHGDKDTFFFGFLLAHHVMRARSAAIAGGADSTSPTTTHPTPVRFHHMPHPVAFSGFYNKQTSAMAFTSFIHFDSQDQPAFFHHTGILGKKAIARFVDDPIGMPDGGVVGTGAVLQDGVAEEQLAPGQDVQGLLEADMESVDAIEGRVGAGGVRAVWAQIMVYTKIGQALAYEKGRVYPVDIKSDHIVNIPREMQQIGIRYVDAIQQFYAHKV